MGNLVDFESVLMDILSLEDEVGRTFETFIETGYGNGRTIDWAIQKDYFKDIVTIELVPETCENARKRFDDPRFRVIEGSSHEKLEKVIEGAEGDCLIYLDAHCPGQFNPQLKDKIKDVVKRYSMVEKWPLGIELGIVTKFNHIVIIDDAKKQVNLDFLKSQLTDGWEFRYYNVGTGYVLLIPPV